MSFKMVFVCVSKHEMQRKRENKINSSHPGSKMSTLREFEMNPLG